MMPGGGGGGLAQNVESHARIEFGVEWGGGRKLTNGVELCGHKMGVKFVRLSVIWG